MIDYSNAPKTFRIYAENEEAEEFHLLGTYEFDMSIKGEYRNPVQNFRCKHQTQYLIISCMIPTQKIVLEILSNYGDPEATCVYQLMVHSTWLES